MLSPREVWLSRAPWFNGGEHGTGTRSLDCRPTDWPMLRWTLKSLSSEVLRPVVPFPCPCVRPPASASTPAGGVLLAQALDTSSRLEAWLPFYVSAAHPLSNAMASCLTAPPLPTPPQYSWSPPIRTHKTLWRPTSIIPPKTVLITSVLF